MSLRARAALDLRSILEDTRLFGCPCTVTNTDGFSLEMVGQYRDISLSMDLQTGQQAATRQASIVLSLRSLLEPSADLPDGLGMPVGVAPNTGKPWIVELTDQQGKFRTFRITDVMPDELGAVVCTLGIYQRR